MLKLRTHLWLARLNLDVVLVAAGHVTGNIMSVSETAGRGKHALQARLAMRVSLRCDLARRLTPKSAA